MNERMKTNSSNETTAVNNPAQGTSQIADQISQVSKPKKRRKTTNKLKTEKQVKTKSLHLVNRKLQLVDILNIHYPNGKNESYKNVVKEIDMTNIHPEHYRAIKTLVSITNGFLHGKQLDNKSPLIENLNKFLEQSELMLKEARARKAKETPGDKILPKKDPEANEDVEDNSTTLERP